MKETILNIICVVGIMAIAVGLFYLQRRTNFYWKIVGWSKWRELQPELENIRDINNRANGVGGKIGWIDRNITKNGKKSFNASKQAYIDYIDFCTSKHLALPPNNYEIEELIKETEAALMSPGEALDMELERTSKRYDEAYAVVSEAGEKLLCDRQEAIRVIESLEELINSIAQHPKSFETEINEIIIQKQQFKSTIEFGIEQQKALQKSAKSAGAAVTAGTAVASMAPTAAMWVATTFGTASTGTAISALSGAAATNAALAWLGGGALATGGGGMAAGQALLALAGPVGWGIAGTSILASVLFMWRKRRKIQESKKDEIARLKNCITALWEVEGKIGMIANETSALYDKLTKMSSSCQYMRGGDYTTFSDEQKMALGAVVNNAKALSALLNKTVAE